MLFAKPFGAFSAALPTAAAATTLSIKSAQNQRSNANHDEIQRTSLLYYWDKSYFSYNEDMAPLKKISLNKKKIALFCQKHHIASLGLFGSILTDQFSSKSDVDVLVEFKKKHIPNLFDLVDMELELCTIIGRPVDLKIPHDLSPYFRKDVLSQAKIIYG